MNAPINATRYPTIGTGPVSVNPYLSADYFELERERVFKRCWIKAARAEELPRPRDYKVVSIPFAHAEVIVVRGEDNTIRGFYNTCSHRGNKVIWQRGHGHAQGGGMVCRFHGWTYSTKGEVLSVPEEGAFFDLDKAACALTPVATDVWEGFIFINLDPSPRETLADYLGEMGERMAGFPYSEMTATYRYETVLNCNWKIAQDAFSEGYHVATIHAGSFPDTFTTDLLNVQLLGIHHSGSACQGGEPSPTPVAALSHKLATTSVAKPGERTMLPPKVNPDRDPRFGFEVAVFFPNYLVHIMDGLYFTHQFTPIDVDHTLWEGIQYFTPPRNVGERFSHEYGQVLQRNAWLEDTGTMEDTHAALKSGAKRQINLQDGEILIRHLLQTVDQLIKA